MVAERGGACQPTNIDAPRPVHYTRKLSSDGRRSQVVRQRSAKPPFAGSIPAVASNSVSSISTPANFHFASTVVSHGWYRLAPFRWVRQEETLHRPLVLGGKPVDLAISFDGHELRVEGAVDDASDAELRRKLSRMFQLGIDTSEFVALSRASQTHGWVASSGFGRLLCGATLFEDVVKIIATTNTMWKQTVRMTELLVEKCGRRTKSGRAAFPEPADVARFSADELQLDCRLGYRAKSIHTLATGILSGAIDLNLMSDPSQSTAELFASYRELPGIGPYGAAHLLAMDGRHDFIAVDTEFRRFVRERYHGGRPVSDRTMLRRYAKWGRWKYLAYWSELWESVAAGLEPTGAEGE
jgi:3-methyladenine DNA glycosylase/8-oxoguanine DNA glycosylase